MARELTGLAAVLKKYNISIPNLELRSGIARNHLYKYARGERQPTAENIFKLMLAVPGVFTVRDFLNDKKAKKIEKELKKKSGYTLVI